MTSFGEMKREIDGVSIGVSLILYNIHRVPLTVPNNPNAMQMLLMSRPEGPPL